MLLVLTFYDGVVVEVQVEQKEHVQQPQRPTEDEPRRLTHSPREQRRHLRAHTHTHKQVSSHRERVLAQELMGSDKLTMRSVDRPPSSSHSP